VMSGGVMLYSIA